MATKTVNDVTNTQAEWEAGTLDATSGERGVLQLAYDPVVYRHDFDSVDGWEDRRDTGKTLSVVDGPSRIGKAARAAPGVHWFADTSVAIPYDPTKLYEVSARVRVVDMPTTSRIYIGLEGVASDGVTLINAGGNDDFSSQHYIAANSYYLKPAEGWKTFRGYVKGNSTASPHGKHDPTAPATMYTGVAFVRPMFIVNYDVGDGVSEVAWMQIREVPAPVNVARGKPVYPEHPMSSAQPAYRLTDGDRDTYNYASMQSDGNTESHMTIDLGALYPINQIGVWHYYLDGRTYYKTRTEISNGAQILYHTPTPLADYSSWVIGTNGTQGAFAQNGDTAENAIIEQADPFGLPTAVWECRPGSTSDGDGGWNMLFPCDDTKTYRLTCFVRKQADLADGSTYFGCENAGQTQNLNGTTNTNPYFWNGDLPALDTWYLMVGIIHPAGYIGGDTGVAGLYSMSGGRITDWTEYRMSPGATVQEMRAYLYYATNTSTRQQFVYPRVDVVDGTEPSIKDLVSAMMWQPVFDSGEASGYAEGADGKWHGLETTYARYIRDRVAGSTSNTGDHWVEIEAYGYDEKPASGTRTSSLSLAPAGRITSTLIDWYDRPGVMLSAGSVIEVPYQAPHAITSEITIEAEVCWMGPGGQDDRSAILIMPSAYYFQIREDGRLACYTFGPSGESSEYTESTATLEAGKWQRAVFTEDASGYRRLYINDVEVAGEQKQAGIGDTGRRQSIAIGAQLGYSDCRDLRAGVREVRLWDHARTPAELSDNARVRLTGGEPGLRGYWPLDEGSGIHVADLTGNSDGRIASLHPRWMTCQVETNVSLDDGATWQGWKIATKGAPIADIPADHDGRQIVVQCRQTLNAPDCESMPEITDLTVQATGSRVVMRRWDGTAWVEHPLKAYDGAEWITTDPRMFIDGRWL